MLVSIFAVAIPSIAESNLSESTIPGAGPEKLGTYINELEQIGSTDIKSTYDYNSYIFTVADVVFFSYEDGTALELYNSTGTLVWSGILNKGGHQHLTVSQGVYKASGSKKFAVLTGDPITRYVVGYYAMDQNGYGASTEIFTWVPTHAFDGEKFIIFSYYDNTNVSLSYTDNGTVIWSGTLNRGEHHEEVGIYNQYLHVESDNPVSALTYYDQGYFVPSANKKFSGTEFYTYVGKVGGWTQDLTVMAYNDNTRVTIKDSDNGTLIWSGILNSGKAHVENFTGIEKYITVTSSDTVTVSVQPWFSWTSAYHQGASVADSTGTVIGTDIIGSTLDGGYLYIFAYKNSTTVNVYNSTSGAFVNSYNLNEGDYVEANPGNGLWRIRSNNYVSAYSGRGQWNADFAPVEFGEVVKRPDLVITDQWYDTSGKIWYEIKNIGFEKAEEGHHSTLYVDGYEVSHDPVNVTLAPGESSTESFMDYTLIWDESDKTVTVCADDYKKIDEINEKNNCRKEIWLTPIGWYYKPPYPNYAPSGMPDFDQNQDKWRAYCGPTAVANCFWWFDSKYADPKGSPGDGKDTFRLVVDYGAKPPVPGPNTDDHNFNNVDDLRTPPGPEGELIERLAYCMGTDPEMGTDVHRMEECIDKWLVEAGLDGELYEHTVKMPEFKYIVEEVEKSQDVILLLGFWVEIKPGVWERWGGHYVTVAGVNPKNQAIAISDPGFDQIPAASPTEHNNAKIVSHDIWPVKPDSPSPGGKWWLPSYGMWDDDGKEQIDHIKKYYAQNVPEEFMEFQSKDDPAILENPIHAEIEYAVIISPKCEPSIEVDKKVWEPAEVVVTPVDVIFAIDLTGSMFNEIDVVKSNASDIMNDLRTLIPDSQFGLVTFTDYPKYYEEYCNYTATYGYPELPDWPYRLDQTLTTNVSKVNETIAELILGNGGDGPQDYTRVLWECGVNDTSNIGWRADATKIVIMFGDAPTHDCDFFAPTSYGGDPGPDEIANTADDLDFETVVAQIAGNDLIVLSVDSSNPPGGDAETSFKYMAYETGGQYYPLSDADEIPDAVLKLVTNIFGEWVEEINANVGDIVRFNCTVHNNGECCDLTNIIATDILSDSLEYADHATVNGKPLEPVAISPKEFYWKFPDWVLKPCQSIIIQFDAKVVECGVDVNTQKAEAVCVETGEVVVDKDTATVIAGTPEMEWTWNSTTVEPDYDQVMMAPVVADLNDDNIPDVIFSTFKGNNYTSDGILRAISGDSGSELFSVTDPGYRVHPGAEPAVADIDNDNKPEIMASKETGEIICFENDGTFKWVSSGYSPGRTGIAVADLDQDGTPEIVSGRVALNNDGTVRWTGTSGSSYLSAVADLDLDGLPEVVTGSTAYRYNGSIFWTSSHSGKPAIGNFDDDPYPEIVVVGNNNVSLKEHDGTLKWGPVAMPGGGGNGPPVVADIDGDGNLEIGVGGRDYYVTFETDGSIKWMVDIVDTSSQAAGSSAFDFDEDGSAEIVYSDHYYHRIFRGSDGKVLFETPGPSGTLCEQPVIVDVDNDGHVEIVFAVNNYAFGGNTGIEVYGSDDCWPTARCIWNQHTYHITNINDDGTVPQFEANNWDIFNNYRAQSPKSCCKRSIDVDKKVLDPETGKWVERIEARVGDIVRFNCTVHNDGTCCDLTDIVATDVLSDSLKYANNATVNGEPWEPILISPKEFTWKFSDWVLEPCQSIVIQFDAEVIKCGIDVNTQMAKAVCLDTGEVVEDKDTATVVVPCVPLTIVSIEDGEAPPGKTVIVPINITNVTDLGAVNIWLTYNNSIVEVTAISDGDLGSVTYNIDNSNGTTNMAWFSAYGQTGNFVFAYVTLEAVGEVCNESKLTLDVKELVDSTGTPIPHTVINGKFHVISPLMEGDVSDLNNCVSMVDAMFIAQYVVGIRDLNESQLECADTTDEGAVSMVDAMHIAQWVVGKPFKPLWESPADDHMLKPKPCY